MATYMDYFQAFCGSNDEADNVGRESSNQATSPAKSLATRDSLTIEELRLAAAGYGHNQIAKQNYSNRVIDMDGGPDAFWEYKDANRTEIVTLVESLILFIQRNFHKVVDEPGPDLLIKESRARLNSVSNTFIIDPEGGPDFFIPDADVRTLQRIAFQVADREMDLLDSMLESDQIVDEREMQAAYLTAKYAIEALDEKVRTEFHDKHPLIDKCTTYLQNLNRRMACLRNKLQF